MKKFVLLGSLLGGLVFLFAAQNLNAASCFVECESFKTLGGWVVDPHSMRHLGSSYVMAHGYGKPVENAVTKVTFPEAGTYTVWARTRDWTAVWERGTPAGRFQVQVNGTPLPTELGTNGKEWRWQKAGSLTLPQGEAFVELHDLTGFNGRCDALYFSTDASDVPPDGKAEMEAFRRTKTGIELKDFPESFDLVVVGGGMSGICAAMSAARLGMKVVLLQDREVLGGCNSSEIRVGLGGHIHVAPYPQLGNIVYEIQPLHGSGGTYPAEFYEDARKEILFKTPNCRCRLLLREHVYALEMDPEKPKRIRSVISRNTHTGAETRFTAPLFVDATGDAVLARLAGCEVMYGREARSKFNEINAPIKADRQVMGHSVLWYARRAEEPVTFPDIDWALPFSEDSVYYIRGGDWEQEAGQYRDMADETEIIRDYGLLSIYSNWSYIKNHSKRKAEYARDFLSWVSPIGGKRESYRTVGDHILTQNDLEDQVKYPDQTAAITWDIDLHFPDPANEAKFKEPFRSCAYHRGFGAPYPVPYRCLYARDCENLFLAGRHISTSHVAFAAVRVMRTLGMLGEVVGMAASICKEHGVLPRGVYEKHLDELKAKMEKGVPRLPTYHAYGSGFHETYHFKELGHLMISPNPTPNLSERVKSAIKELGMIHRNEHPELRERKDLPPLVIESGAQFRPDDSVENDLVLNGASLFFTNGETLLYQEVTAAKDSENFVNVEAESAAVFYRAVRGEGKSLTKTGKGTLKLTAGVTDFGSELHIQEGKAILQGEKNQNFTRRTGRIFVHPGAELHFGSRNVLGIWTHECRTLPEVLGIDSAVVVSPKNEHVNLGHTEMFNGTLTSPEGAFGSELLGNFCLAGKVTARGKSRIKCRSVSIRADISSVDGQSGVFDVPTDEDELRIESGIQTFHDGKVTKLGAGTLTFAGNSSEALEVEVKGGILRLTAPSAFRALRLNTGTVLLLDSAEALKSIGSFTADEGARIEFSENVSEEERKALLRKLSVTEKGTF